MKVGIMVGREKTFPESIIPFINNSGTGVEAELVKIGGLPADALSKYSVVIDRISHDVPFYRTAMKQAVLNGTVVLVNPFWFAADDKHFGTALCHKLGIAIPKTVLLPQRSYKSDISNESLRNLEFPIDWQGIVNYVGLPAIMKPADGGGWRGVNKINDIDELMHHYNESGESAMMLQEFIKWDRYTRTYCIGGEKTLVMGFDPKPLALSTYFSSEGYLEKPLHDRIAKDSLTISRALGYEINACEFAVRDGIPYAIDFTNPVCDSERRSVGDAHHEWFVKHVGELAIKFAKNPPGKPGLRHIDLMRSHNPAN